MQYAINICIYKAQAITVRAKVFSQEAKLWCKVDIGMLHK